MPDTQLSAQGLHLFVTRNATIAYQHATGLRFEEARRELTLRILSAPEDLTQPDTFLLLSFPYFRALTRREGPLLIVPKIEPM